MTDVQEVESETPTKICEFRSVEGGGICGGTATRVIFHQTQNGGWTEIFTCDRHYNELAQPGKLTHLDVLSGVEYPVNGPEKIDEAVEPPWKLDRSSEESIRPHAASNEVQPPQEFHDMPVGKTINDGEFIHVPTGMAPQEAYDRHFGLGDYGPAPEALEPATEAQEAPEGA